MKGSARPFAKISPNLSANRTQKDACDPAKVMPGSSHTLSRCARGVCALNASGLGTTSGLTWLMLPLCEDVKRLAHATTLPIVLRVDFSAGVDALRERVQEALSYPNIIGIMADTSLVYPSEGSVEDAVKAALELIA